MTWQQQLQHLKNQFKNCENEGLQNPNPLTPAMEEVIAMRQKRISVEIDIPITPEPSDSENSDFSDTESFSSHEEYTPKPAKKPKKSRDGDPFEFNDDEREEVGVYKSPVKSCLNIVNTGQCKNFVDYYYDSMHF